MELNGKIIGAAAVTASLTQLWGGFDAALKCWLFLMISDYILGILCAITKKSLKTETGGLSSKVGMIGLARKFSAFLFIIIAHQLDVTMGINYCRDLTLISLIINELISITENAGILGTPIPPVIANVIDVLKKKEGTENE